MAEVNEKHRPEHLSPVSFSDLGRLAVGPDRRLYWDGAPVQTQQRLTLTLWQNIVAAITALAIILGGLGALAQGLDAGHQLGCRLDWWNVGCQKSTALQHSRSGQNRAALCCSGFRAEPLPRPPVDDLASAAALPLGYRLGVLTAKLVLAHWPASQIDGSSDRGGLGLAVFHAARGGVERRSARPSWCT
jgi:hypothetical protein